MLITVSTYFIVLSIFIPLISLHVIHAQNNTIIRENIYGVSGSKTDVLLNPDFTLFNNVSKFPSSWNDSMNSCKGVFSCMVDTRDGFNDKVSFMLSTKNNNVLWSWVRDNQIDVQPNQRYELVTHMKLNDWATQSHIVLEGFNQTSKSWYQIVQCPSGINGPLQWEGYICEITIPNNTTQIRPVLNAGGASEPNKDAVTWFDAIHLLLLKG
jgi:hypothetical protein